MRTQPRLRQFISLLAFAALLAGVGTHVFAQETRKEAPATGKEGRAAATPASTYDLEIKDGLLVWSGPPRKDNARQVPANLANVVDLLRELHPEANFAMSPRLADTDISYLKMRSSSLEEKLEAIRIASGGEFLWRNANATAIDPKTGLPVTPGNQPGPALYVLDALPATGKPALQVEAFNIGGYVDSIDDNEKRDKGERQRLNAERLEQIERMVLKTVKEYEALNQVANPKAKSLRTPSIKFHPGANLAIIIGEPEAVAVAAKVIGALPGAQRSVAASVRENDGSTRFHADELIKRARPDVSRPAGQR